MQAKKGLCKELQFGFEQCCPVTRCFTKHVHNMLFIFSFFFKIDFEYIFSLLVLSICYLSMLNMEVCSGTLCLCF